MNPWEMNLNSEDTKVSSTISTDKMPWELDLGNEEPTTTQPSLDIKSMSLAGSLTGTEQVANPFIAAKPKEQPIMDLTANKTMSPSLTIQELEASSNQEIVADVQAVHQKYSTMGNTLLGFVDEDARNKAEVATKSLEKTTMDELKARGIPAEYRNGTLYTYDTQGNEIEVDDPSILQSLYRTKLEFGGAIAGGIGGAKLGSRVPTPIGKAIGTVGGAVIGSAIGAATGTGADVLLANINLVNKANDDVVYSKMLDSGVADIVMGPLGYVAGKAVVGSGKFVKKVFDYVFEGNSDGAYQHLLNHMGYDETQAKEVVAKLEDLVGPLRGTDKEKAIYALTQTQKGGEAIIGASSQLDPTASATVRNQVAKRAEDVLKITDELRADNVQAIVNQNLKSYTDEVKGFYRQVKEAPKEFTTEYSFDFDKLGIQPIVETIGAKIENPAIKQRFVNTLTKIEQASEGRTFNDLIDLRQAVNDIKFNGPNLKFSDAKTLDNAISAIDNEIDTAAKTHIPQYETWAKNWDTAKVEYAKMKDLESNILYKVLTKPGINEDTVVKAFTKYIGAGDNTFYQVMEKLPKNVQNRIEGSVLNNLTEKYAAGTIGGNRAIHFPLLSQELKKVSWQAPKTKQTVRTINRMAEVFKNDVNLARVSGGIEIPRFQSYLTTDPIVRLKFEVASKFFNHIKQFYPGDEANALALVKHASKLLENPISDKSLKDMMRTIPIERRKFREKLEFADDMEAIKQAYLERQMALKQMFNKDIPPRLVWKSNPDDLARLQNPEATILPSVDEVLYGTAKGTIGRNPSEVNLTEKAGDLLTEFIWRNTQGKSGEAITEAAFKYMEDNRFTNIMTNASKKLSKEDFENNAKIVANSIKSEAGILIKRIEKDFGVKLPKSEAEKLVALKFKEIMEQCNGK